MARRVLRIGDAANAGRVRIAEGSEQYVVVDPPSGLTSDQPVITPWQYSGYAASASHPGTTGAETQLTPASSFGTQTVAVEQMVAGALIQFLAALRFTTDNDGAETLAVIVYFGTTPVISTGALNVAAASVTDSPMFINGYIKIRTAGAAGAGVGYGNCSYQIGAGTPVVQPFVTPFSSFDTTLGKGISLFADWGGTTDAADTLVLEDLVIKY